MVTKFIHAADLHIDSPLVGLCCYEGAPAERLREATRRALENLVDLAIEEEVALVILAGDLFDGKWRNVQTGLFTARQFRRLGDAHIGVYLVRGNHDAESQVRSAITWPENVREFSVRRAETFRLDDLGVALHGRGFALPEVPDDPVPEYPAAIGGLFNIGVLHTNVGGSEEHPRYAPTTREALEAKGYDYWALGHIHKRCTISDRPHIAYSGNTQGRHVRETGPKGCLLVSVEDGQLAGVEFRPTDVVRWHRPEIVLATRDGLPELYAAVREQLERCARKATAGSPRYDSRLPAAALHIMPCLTARRGPRPSPKFATRRTRSTRKSGSRKSASTLLPRPIWRSFAPAAISWANCCDRSTALGTTRTNWPPWARTIWRPSSKAGPDCWSRRASGSKTPRISDVGCDRRRGC